MGSAASIETSADSPAARNILKAVQDFHEALLCLVQYATNRGQEQDLLQKSDLNSLVAGIKMPAELNFAAVDLARDLSYHTFDELLQLAVGAKQEKEEEMPEGPLLNFVPVARVPEVAKIVQESSLVLGQAQQIVAHPDSELTQQLTEAVADLSSTMTTAVVKRCHLEGIAKQCHDVVEAANADFRSVYSEVWARVKKNEKAGINAYRESAATLRFPLKGTLQKASDPIELLRHGTSVQPQYRDIVTKQLVADVDGARPRVPSALKSIVRIVEKSVLNTREPIGKCNRVFDVVRGMVECTDMETIAQVLDNIRGSEAIELVRMKDRFFVKPSPGGWRDCMVCFVVKGDPHQHVCEVQLVHHDLLTARKGLPGHAIYNRARNANELLECLWACQTFFEVPWTVEQMDHAGFSPPDCNLTGRDEGLGWGTNGKALFALTTGHKSWEGLGWGYATRPPVKVQKWKGVTVAESGEGIEKLDISSCNLEGRIPTEFGQLSQLTYLGLDGNKLTGRIPTEFGQLSQLERLYLTDNKLTGRIPTEFGRLSQLRALSLSYNKLTGTAEFKWFIKKNVPRCYITV